jgi:hypothetical protein
MKMIRERRKEIEERKLWREVQNQEREGRDEN